jgi:colanic acid/amylovoran biosynthesis glycosyltransferase
MPKKGLTDGLAACRIARARGADLRVTVIGASKGDSVGNQIRDELLNLASSSELSGRVEFPGFLPLQSARELIQTHQVFLCPSKHAGDGDAEGGSPVALTEAMASGLICVGTRHCDIPEVILHGETGYLVDEGNVAQMADISCGLAGNTATAHAMVKRGRRHIEDRFSLSTQLQDLRKIYASTVDSHGGKAVCG